jgi:hypothetical protein
VDNPEEVSVGGESWPSYMKLEQSKDAPPVVHKNRAQKEYTSKLLPKHYIEDLKNKRIQKFEEFESMDA